MKGGVSGAKRNLVIALAALGALAVAPVVEASGNCPNKPIRLVVPFSPGGAADNNMRIIGQKLSERLGESVIVENKPGAAGMVAINTVRRSPADGHTLLYTSVSSAVTSAKQNAPYNMAKDFSPVIQTNYGPLIFYVRPDTPVQNMKGLIDYIKQNPGKLNYATIGVGSGPHLAMEHFKQVFGLDILHIPYKSSGESSSAVMGGVVQIGIDPLSAVVPLLQAGQVKPLAVTSLQRSKAYPDIPGMADEGLSEYQFTSWAGISVMPGTAGHIIDRLNAELNEVLKDPAVINSYRQQAAEVKGGSPADYQAFAEQQLEQIATIRKNANLELD